MMLIPWDCFRDENYTDMDSKVSFYLLLDASSSPSLSFLLILSSTSSSLRSPTPLFSLQAKREDTERKNFDQSSGYFPSSLRAFVMANRIRKELKKER